MEFIYPFFISFAIVFISELGDKNSVISFIFFLKKTKLLKYY